MKVINMIPLYINQISPSNRIIIINIIYMHDPENKCILILESTMTKTVHMTQYGNSFAGVLKPAI